MKCWAEIRRWLSLSHSRGFSLLGLLCWRLRRRKRVRWTCSHTVLASLLFFFSVGAVLESPLSLPFLSFLCSSPIRRSTVVLVGFFFSLYLLAGWGANFCGVGGLVTRGSRSSLSPLNLSGTSVRLGVCVPNPGILLLQIFGLHLLAGFQDCGLQVVFAVRGEKGGISLLYCCDTVAS